MFSPLHWEMGVANVNLWEGTKKEDTRNLIIIELNRLCFISSKIDSVDSYYNFFSKIYECVEKELGSLDIQRIGCRIQGTYKTKSTDFNSIFSEMQKGFPSQFYLQDFPATDLLFQLNYKKSNFPESYRIHHVGFAIDTDNYLTNETCPINDKKLIKDTYVLSLSVEKKLFDNLSVL